jgi:cytochrome c oxidase subunit II
MFNLPMMPDQASSYARQYDLLFFATLALAVLFTVLVTVLITFFAIRYRRGSRVNRAGAVESHLGLELTWTIIPGLLGVGMFVWAASLYAATRTPPENAMELTVIAKQWMWHIQHPNGVRENNELHVPLGRAVRLTMISQDVIHSFFLPQFRIKQDVLPGRYTYMWFTPTKLGKFNLFCAEYCGTNHSEMGGYVYVVPPQEYAEWLAAGGTKRQPGQLPEVAGKELYVKLACGSCHNAERGGNGAPLNGLYNSMVTLDNGQKVKADDAFLRESIVNPGAKIVKGYFNVMPAYQGQLTEEQILQLIAYMKSLGGPVTTAPATPVKPEAGKG